MSHPFRVDLLRSGIPGATGRPRPERRRWRVRPFVALDRAAGRRGSRRPTVGNSALHCLNCRKFRQRGAGRVSGCRCYVAVGIAFRGRFGHQEGRPGRSPSRTLDCVTSLCMWLACGMRHAVSADGTRIGWGGAGEGAPLVLLHGSVADRGRWATVRDGLARRFTLHLVDRRGRGLSRAETDRPYALAREAEDVAAVLEAAGPGALVLAHSYGGTCALEAAAAGAPMARLLVYEPAFGTAAGPVFPEAALADVEAALARADLEAALETFFADVLLLPAAETAAMRGTPAWRARVACAPTLAREARAANAYRPDAARLAAVTAPARLLLGTETTPALTRSSRAAHAALPGSELRVLPGHGHAAMDADAAMFVTEVENWLGISP